MSTLLAALIAIEKTFWRNILHAVGCSDDPFRSDYSGATKLSVSRLIEVRHPGKLPHVRILSSNNTGLGVRGSSAAVNIYINTKHKLVKGETNYVNLLPREYCNNTLLIIKTIRIILWNWKVRYTNQTNINVNSENAIHRHFRTSSSWQTRNCSISIPNQGL